MATKRVLRAILKTADLCAAEPERIARFDALFMGRAAEYQHFVKQLDAFPPGARLAAYVRSAEAVMMFSRLAQSQS